MATHAATLLFALSVAPVLRAAEPVPATPAATNAGVGPSAAQKESARTWLREGYELLEQKQYAAALERFTAAYRLVPVPTTGLAVARAQEGLGQWVEANARAIEVINMPRQAGEPEVFETARADARALWDRLGPLIPSVRITISPSTAAARLSIDGADMPTSTQGMSFRLNPGEHRLVVGAAGHLPQERSFTLKEKEHQQLAIILVPTLPSDVAATTGDATNGANAASTTAASAGSRGSEAALAEDAGSGARTRGYIGLGVAGVAALTGTVTGILAFSNKPDCPDDVCVASQKDAADTSKMFGNIATVSFGVAGLATAYALWELLANAPADTELATTGALPSVTFVRSGAKLELSGHF